MTTLSSGINGVRIGHAHDAKLASGTTAVIFDEPVIAAIDVRGGGPGTRDASLLDVANTVERVDALVLSGGSAFGLDAPGGVHAYLAEHGRGFAIGNVRVPIVPGAIVFDLLNGGDKNWGRFSPYRELGYAAAQNATSEFSLGSVGAGHGATTANLQGGFGAAIALAACGAAVAAFVVVNAVGSVVVGDGPWFWAAPFERDAEFGGRGWPESFTPQMLAPRLKGAPDPKPGANTTIAVVVTNARLTKAQTQRLAVMTQTGFARAIYPVHAPLDGDVVFAAATGEVEVDPLYGITELGTVAANAMARAIARGVYEASALAAARSVPTWRERFAR